MRSQIAQQQIAQQQIAQIANQDALCVGGNKSTPVRWGRRRASLQHPPLQLRGVVRKTKTNKKNMKPVRKTTKDVVKCQERNGSGDNQPVLVLKHM